MYQVGFARQKASYPHSTLLYFIAMYYNGIVFMDCTSCVFRIRRLYLFSLYSCLRFRRKNLK